jgi:hypothetical protein
MALFAMVAPDKIGPGMKQTHRRHLRRPVEAALLVRGIGSSVANAQRGHCVDLSEAGAGVIVAGEWRPGQVVTMELNPPAGGESVLLSARVCHRNEQRCGFEFLAPSAQALNLIRALCPQA